MRTKEVDSSYTRNPEREWSGGEALIEVQRIYPQAEILEMYTMKIFDTQLKITY